MEHRAPIVVRVFVGLLALGALVANVALLLSDRAPRALRLMFGDFAQRLSNRLDRDGRAGAALTARDVGSDSLVHFGLWAVATVLVGIAMWSWIGLAASSLALAGVSLLTEVAQGRYTSMRDVEQQDAVFNLFGIGAGVAAVALLYILYDTVAGWAMHRVRSPGVDEPR